METLGERVRRRMEEKELTVPDLVRRQVLSRAGIYNILNGTADPSLIKTQTVDKLCRALAVHRDWLLYGRGPKESGAEVEVTSQEGGLQAPPRQASQPVRLDPRSMAIAAGALTRFLARRDDTLDITQEADAELLCAVIAEYELSRSEPDADMAFGASLADIVQAYEARDGRRSKPTDGPARKQVRR